MVTVTLPVDYNRNYARAPFTDMVFNTTALLNTYLTNPVRYAGMAVSLVEGGIVTQYVLSADTNSWEDAGGSGGGSGTAVATSDKLKMIEALANSTTTTWLGDSITENVSNGYIRHIDALFPDNVFTDRAVGGHTTGDMILTPLTDAIADNAEHYVIAIGLNDIRYFNDVGGTGIGAKTPAAYVANIKTATDALKATTESPKISVINIFPTAWKDAMTELSHHDQIEKTREWNNALEAFCSEEGLFYIDVFETIYDKINAHNALTLYSDSVHPSSHLADPTLDTGSLLYASAILNEHATSTAEELIPTGEHFFKVILHDPEEAAANGYIILKNIDVDVIEDFALSQSTSVTTNLYSSTFNPAANYQNKPFEFDYSMMFSTATYPTNGVSLTSAFSGIGFPRGPKSFSTYYSRDSKAISDPKHESWELVAQELSNNAVAVNVLPPSRKGFYYQFRTNGIAGLNMKKIDMGVAPIRVNFQNLTVAGLAPRFADFFKGNLTVSGDGLSGNEPNYIITWEAPYELSELDIEAFSGLENYTIYRSFDGQALSDFSHASWTNLGSGTQNGIIKLEKLGIGAGSTGVLLGGELSIGTPTSTFSIADGNGLVIDTHTDANNPVSVAVSWSGLTNIVLDDISAAYTSVAINQLGAVIQRPNGGFTRAETRDFIVKGALVHQDGVSIDSISFSNQLSFGGLHSLYDLGNSLGQINESGNVYGGTAGVGQLERSAGVTFSLGSNYDISRKDPNRKQHVLETPLVFNYNYQDGVGGYTTVQNATALDSDFYDDGTGTLQALSNNRWKIDRVHFIPNLDFDVIQYGQAEYSSLDNAIVGLNTEEFVSNPQLAGTLLRGFIIVQKGHTDLTDSTGVRFIEADKFGERALGAIGSAVPEQDYHIRQLENFEQTSPVSWFANTPNVLAIAETVNQLDGTRSAKMTQSGAASVDKITTPYYVFTDDVYKNKKISFDFGFNSNAIVNSYRVKTIIWDGSADREVGNVLIDKTGIGSFHSEFFVETTDVDVRLEIFSEIPNDANELIMDNFRLDLSPTRIKAFTVTETATYYNGGTKNGSNYIKFATQLYDDSGAVFSVANSDHTRYTFLKEATFNISGSHIVVGSPFVGIKWFDSSNNSKLVSYEQSTQNTGTASMVGKAQVGDYIIVQSNLVLSTNNDSNFSITATAQSSGTVFATDSNKEDVVVYAAGGSGSIGVGIDIPFSETKDSHDAFDGVVFKSPMRGIYTFNGSVAVSSNMTNFFMQYYIGGISGGTIQLEPGNTTVFPFSFTIELQKNEELSLRTDTTASLANLTDHHWLSITKQSVNVDNLIIENFGTVVAASTLGTGELENVFSARIANNGTASVTSQSQPFVDSVTRTALGFVQVNYASLNLANPPSISAVSELDLRDIAVESVTATEAIFTIRNTGSAVFLDAPFSFHLQTQGSDYKSKANYIDSLIIENYDGETTTDSYHANVDASYNLGSVYKAMTENMVTVDDINGNSIRITNNSDEPVILNASSYMHAGDAGANTYSGATWFNSAGIQITKAYSVDVNVSALHVSNASANVKLAVGDFIYTSFNRSAVYGDGGINFTVWKPAKKLGVDQLGQVVTNHVTGGTEYELKGQLWNGKQIYARSWELANDITSTTTLDTLPVGLKILNGVAIHSSTVTISAHSSEIDGSNFAWFQYVLANGAVQYSITGMTVYAGTIATIKYIKP